MQRGWARPNRIWIRHVGLFGLLLILSGRARAVEPSTAAAAVYRNYVAAVEARLARQHGAAEGFLAGAALDAVQEARLRAGGLVLEQLTAPEGMALPGALLHHWRATAFVPGATAAEMEGLLRDFDGYPRIFAPEVLRSRVEAEDGDRFQILMRVRHRQVLTVVLDTAYEVSFGALDGQHGFSASRSTRIAEIANAGTSEERALTAAEDHGFLWRQNTYWSWEEREGGLEVQIESVSLSRNIPYGLAWAVGPYLARVPRASLTFTLGCAAAALRAAEKGRGR